MAEILIDDEGYEGEQLARITTDGIRWRRREITVGEEVYPADDMFDEEMALAALLANQVIFINTHHWMKDWPEDARNTTALCVNCNDVFAWGCADAERIILPELPDLYDMWLRDRYWGAAVWCMIKRNQMPQGPVESAIRADNKWDIDALKLGENWQDEEVSRMFRAINGHAS